MKTVQYLGEIEGEDGTVFVCRDKEHICLFTSGCVIDYIHENEEQDDSPLKAIKIDSPNIGRIKKDELLKMINGEP